MGRSKIPLVLLNDILR